MNGFIVKCWIVNGWIVDLSQKAENFNNKKSRTYLANWMVESFANYVVDQLKCCEWMKSWSSRKAEQYWPIEWLNGWPILLRSPFGWCCLRTMFRYGTKAKNHSENHSTSNEPWNHHNVTTKQIKKRKRNYYSIIPCSRYRAFCMVRKSRPYQ